MTCDINTPDSTTTQGLQNLNAAMQGVKTALGIAESSPNIAANSVQQIEQSFS